MEDTTEKNYVLFKTSKPRHAMILKQPFMVVERFKTGDKKGKVKSRRQAQYNEDYQSIYVDEQRKIDPQAKPTTVIIRKGKVLVDNDNISLLEALRTHPDNIKNGGKEFKEVDIEKEDLYEIEAFKLLDEANMYLMTADDSDIRTLATDVIGVHVVHEKLSKLRKQLRSMASVKSNEKSEKLAVELRQTIVKFKEDENKTERLLTVVALENNVISLKQGNKIVWGNTSELIFTATQKNDVIKEFSLWIKNDKEGREIYTSIAKKIEEIQS